MRNRASRKQKNRKARPAIPAESPPGTRGLFVLDVPLHFLADPLKARNFRTITLEREDLTSPGRLKSLLIKRTLVTASPERAKRLREVAAIMECGIVHLAGFRGKQEIGRRKEEIAGALSKAFAKYRLDPMDVSRNCPTGAFYFRLDSDGGMKREDLV